MRLGKVVKSNSHCDYIVELDDEFAVDSPPQAADYGFGSFVKLDDDLGKHWAVGLIYNTQLFNPMFLSNGPRLSSDPDPLFTPDLIRETRTLLGVVLIGTLEAQGDRPYGIHGIPRAVVPVNTPVFTMTQQEVHRFHINEGDRPQFCYYSHLMRSGGSFASELAQQVLQQLIESTLFAGADQRALQILYKELCWKTTLSAVR
jgi:hypothetical protein